MLIKVLDRDLYKEELTQGFQGKRDGDAGIDLRCPRDLLIPQGSAIPVPLGICVQLPPETVGWVTGRSSTSVKMGLLTHEGKIDRGYRGEIHALVQNVLPTHQVAIKRGDRIAQLVVVKVVLPGPQMWRVVDELGVSERGDGGLGSTGTT